MGVPRRMIELMRDDVVVLATMAATNGPITTGIVNSVEAWFSDVEVKYPIAEMPLEDEERNELLISVSKELVERFHEALSQVNDDELADEVFEKLGADVDPLWREMTGLLATNLNKRFEAQRIAEEDIPEVTESIKEALGDGEEEVRERLTKDAALRTHLRRIGLDPDKM